MQHHLKEIVVEDVVAIMFGDVKVIIPNQMTIMWGNIKRKIIHHLLKNLKVVIIDTQMSYTQIFS
jgi:hypothetical protein